jgi:putative restriction endonuclease
MPATQPESLVTAILDAIQESGSSAVVVSPVRQQPRKFVVSMPEGASVSLWVYVWTLTGGGRSSLPNEYRIQMTTVRSPLEINPLGYTVLSGYEPNLKMLAGFDLVRHSTFTTGSPSVQVDIRTIRQALQDGLSFDRKSNDEIAVGIRPDQFVAYMCNAEKLHNLGRQARVLGLLERASSLQTIADEEIAPLPAERQRIVRAISQLSRQASFRQQVLRAHGHRCAVTGAQLRLVDAAHILPVGAPGSTDDIQNGIALSPTYHRAFDNGLIYLNDEYSMQINPQKKSALASLQLDGGLEHFATSLGRILLPPDPRQWPNAVLIRRANRFRQIAG